MSLLQVDQVGKSFGAQVLFAPFSAQVARGDRIALVGDNGVGKSTLLSILAGVEEPSGGKLHRASGLHVGYLPQVARLSGEGTLLQAMRRAFADLFAMEEELRRLEKGMAGARAEDLERYDALLHTFEREGGYEAEAKVRSVLAGVGFAVEEFDRPVAILSGGEEARAALARVLVEEPDLLLLDEPTNHLDFAALDWLEESLSEFQGAILIVSHDRHLLDRTATKTWEIAFSEVTLFRGGYTQSRLEREAERARRLETYKEQEATVERYRDFIRRHHAGQKHGQAKDREKKLERLEKERVERPRDADRITLSIPMGAASGKRVLVTESLEIGFSRALFSCEDLVLYRGEKVAVIGENGCGKTTLLRTITGQTAPVAGKVALGHGVRPAVFSQTQEGLDGNGTVLDLLLSRSGLSISQARGLLGRFLFSGDDALKRMKALSGGERSRIALALLSLIEGNLLLLDEPTNHLDLASQEILEQALVAYEGTVLLVSHDRALLEAVTTQVWEVRDERLRVVPRGYRAYRERGGSGVAEPSSPPARAERERKVKRQDLTPALPRPEKADRYQERRREEARRALEAEIEGLEERLADLERSLAEASEEGDGLRVGELGARHAQARAALEGRVAAWERLAGGET